MGQSATFVYVDAAEGWVNINETQTSVTGVPPFVTATGGCVTCCGNFKVHTFLGPGTFCVTGAGTPAGSTKVDYLVVAGGGGGAVQQSGGGGGGGFRSSFPSPLCNAGTVNSCRNRLSNYSWWGWRSYSYGSFSRSTSNTGS